MKFRMQWFAAAAALLPIGVALAEVARDPGPNAPAVGSVPDLQLNAEKVARSTAAAHAQLETAVSAARKRQDMVLLSCLTDKLETVKKLEKKLTSSLDDLRRADDEAAAQRPFVIVTVLGQRVALAMQDAAACVDSKSENGAVSVETITPPGPETDHAFGTDPGDGANVPGLDDLDVPPPLAGDQTETDLDPSTDLPPDGTEPPQVASPTK